MKHKKVITFTDKRFILIPNRPDLRIEAAQLGNRYYYTGAPCINGHMSQRYTANGNCIQCSKEAQKEKNFIIRKLLNKNPENE